MTRLTAWLARHGLPARNPDSMGAINYVTDAGTLVVWTGFSGDILIDFFPADGGDVEWRAFPADQCPEDVRAFIVGASA